MKDQPGKQDDHGYAFDARAARGGRDQHAGAQIADYRREAQTRRDVQALADASSRTLQLRAAAEAATGKSAHLHPAAGNPTGLPLQLKASLEQLSGLDLSSVRVRYNSSKPAQLNAHAYTQGQNIEIGPGQERHLAHEGWHVVQQMRGRVAPRIEAGNVSLNDDPVLEQEADLMGQKALQLQPADHTGSPPTSARTSNDTGIVQLKGVGGSKIGFEARDSEPDKEKIAEGMTLLRAAWQEARTRRGELKQRIGEQIAQFNEAVESNDPQKIEEAEKGIDLLRRPQLHLDKDTADKNFSDLTERISDLRDELFKTDHSKRIFNAERTYSSITPDERRANHVEISTALRAVNKDVGIKALERQANLLREKVKTADAALKNNVADPMSRGLTQVYYDRLVTDIPDEDQLLQTSQAFTDGRLELRNNEIIYRSAGPEVVVCDLRKGIDAFAPVADLVGSQAARAVFRKKGLEDTLSNGAAKEYVKDSRDTLTRRYAYVEKNYYQMMEFFMVGHMTGRFQQYLLAGGNRAPGVHTFTTKMIENVPKQPHAPDKMTDTQVAVAHQMYGSLPEQRGVSLTSTPKVGVTYANTGGNFRTDNGFKLKIDLARVPPDVLFLNHYAEHGVSDMANADYSTEQKHKPNSPTYRYKQSAAHARELFLEHIRPEWVVEIEHHEKGGFHQVNGAQQVITPSAGVELLEAGKITFGGQSFESGFEVGLTSGADVDALKSDSHYTKGKETGELVVKGYAKGTEMNRLKGTTDHLAAFKETVEDPVVKGEMSAWHIGYMQARTGRAQVKTVFDYRKLLNARAI